MTLHLDGAGFTYRGAASAALADLDLGLAPGQMHSILGASGSGTSTLARLITGLLDDSGTVSSGVHITGTAVMLGDDPEAQLSGMTSLVGDEVQLSGRLHGDEIPVVQERAAQSLDSLGIADLWGRRLDTLSGGQRQLVALAGLLAQRPTLLVLDQPALSLDPNTRRRLGQVLQEFCAAGGAALIVAHQFDEVAEACEQLSILDAGRLITTGTRISTQELRRYGIWDTRPRESTRAEDAASSAPAPAPASVALSVRGLTVSRAESAVLDGIDLDLNSGELVTIKGSNGAGKSTLLRCLAGLLESHARIAGTITVDDDGTEFSLGERPSHERAGHLGWVGQDPGSQLSAATVRDELVRAVPLPPHRRRDRATVRAQRLEAVTSVMEEIDLRVVAETHPYDLSIDRRKDLVVASALIMCPRVLLLDEPTLGRDRSAMDRLNTFIKGFLRRGGSVLATTHDRGWAAEASDRMVHLTSGVLRQD